MRKQFYLLLLTAVSFLLLSCSSNSSLVQGQGNLPPTHLPEDATTKIAKHLYGANFTISNSNLYQLLMSSCKRCGLKRFHTNPFGGVTYERIYDLFNSNIIQKCNNWVSNGYIQIKFHGPGLPTKASVTIKPKSSKRDRFSTNNYIWGEAFTIKGTAHPINKNKGFNIRLFPSDGLGGGLSLIIKSTHSNHVTHSNLDIAVTYGSGTNQQENNIMSASLEQLKSEAISSQYTCNQYTN